MKKILFIFVLLGLVSCNEEKNKKVTNSWQEIKIVIENTKELTINKYNDSVFISKKNYEKKIFEKSFFKISKSEKDSVYNLIYKIITKPTFTNKSVTCYAGNVAFSLKDRNTTLTCNYSSVGDWRTISEETKKINILLENKFKNIIELKNNK